MQDLIQPNKFCNELHDGEQIIFCKRDFVIEEFKQISLRKNKVILIVGNSDFTFDNSIMEICPPNVHHIFVSNTTCDNDKVTPIPIGVENQFDCKRNGHGIINNEIFSKLDYLHGEKKVFENKKETKIFASFDINTNFNLRKPLYDYIIKNQNFYFDYDKKNYENFVINTKKHLATLSPRGNGIECIRTYELLYLNEIPLVFGSKQEYSVTYKKLYKELPIVFFDNYEDISDISKIEKEIKKNSLYGKELLLFSYWYDKILNMSKKL